MSARERLETCLEALRSRLRTHIYARAAAAGCVGVLVITCAAVWMLQRSQYAPGITLAGRALLLALLALVAALLLWWPLWRLGRDGGARELERQLPEERGRIETYLDLRRAAHAPPPALIELLAADAAAIAERTPPEHVVPTGRIGAAAAIAATAFAMLALLLAAGPGQWGYASRHLLLGMQLPVAAVPVRRVVVSPGDATVRRNSDVSIRASIEGFHPGNVQVYVRFADREQWERAPMQAGGGDAEFEFKLYAVRGPLQYYVDADGTRSSEHRVSVVDLPRIERVRLTYSYPQWTGLESAVEDSVRDIRAVAGTQVRLDVYADAPLESPVLVVDGGAEPLTRHDDASTGSIEVEKPGRYHIGARVAGELVALTDEYTIEVVADEKPVIEIRRPGRDWRATSIEEVPVRIAAEDDFRLRDVVLRYSVNGGDWQTMRVGGGDKRADHETLLRLEELGAAGATQDAHGSAKPTGGPGRTDPQLAPGDLVSYYAVARDHQHSVETDLFMVQVQPFERRYTQGQAGGAGGSGMSDEQGAISERQREILLATWNLQRGDERTGRPDARSRTQLEDSAKMLADLQATLAQQARTLAQRTRARTFVDQDERVRTFVESLERAAGVMEPASRSLREFRLREAVPAEQQALQQLLRAEAAFRDVQVSMQQNDSGGGGMQASRNFAEMFELEMDLEKNQYESESQLSKQREQQDLDEAIRKLKELAERQEQLAQERRLAGAAQEQRWKQEQLRREAQDLRRRLAELSRERASGQQGQAQNESGSPQEQQAQGQAGAEQEQGSEGGAAGNPARDGSSAARRSNPRLARALESVDQALRDMQSASDPSRPSESSSNEVPRAASAGASEQAQQSARNASRSLREALQQMDRREPSNLDERLGEFADRTRQLAEDQRGVENELHEALAESGSRSGPQRFGSRGVLPPERSQPLLESKEQMAGQLSDLQRDMRAAIHAHRTQAPRSTQRLSEIVRDVEGSDLMYRLNRSAAEIYYGRARDAAAREGLITEALEGLEQALREAAVQAAQEQNAAPENATPEALLSQISELRRALAQAAEDTGQRARGDAQARTDTPQAPDAPGRSAGDRSPGERDGSDRNAPARAGDRSAGGAEQGGAALSAWDPIAPAGPLPRETIADESLARQTAAIGRRVRDLAYGLDRGQLSEAELQALRRTANELRRLSGDPMAGRTDALLALIDQVELAALQASLRGREGAPPRASLPAPEAPRYRDSIAEYYRRLGDR